MPVDPATGQRYPYTAAGKAAFERDQAKRKKRKKRKKRRPPPDDGGLAALIGAMR